MKTDRKKELLEKLLNNQCSREELEELLNFKGSSEFDEQFGEVLDKEWNRLNNLKEINALRGEEIFYDIISRDRIGDKPWYANVYKIAASLLILIMFSGLYYWYQQTVGYITQATGYGKTKKIELSDGSLVTLNANSTIKYKKNWSTNESREVILFGEAFFHVTHKTNNQKFLVKAENVNVEVLGTEFNVFSRNNASSVMLKSGKVKLDVRGKEEIVMKPGELIEVGERSTHVKKVHVDDESLNSWKNNLLIFKSSALSEIAKTIDNTYGVEVIFSDSSIAKETFTGVFPIDENPEVFFQMLAKTYELEVIKKNKKVILKR